MARDGLFKVFFINLDDLVHWTPRKSRHDMQTISPRTNLGPAQGAESDDAKSGSKLPFVSSSPGRMRGTSVASRRTQMISKPTLTRWLSAHLP